jgi:hypothetical protein
MVFKKARIMVSGDAKSIGFCGKKNGKSMSSNTVS